MRSDPTDDKSELLRNHFGIQPLEEPLLDFRKHYFEGRRKVSPPPIYQALPSLPPFQLKPPLRRKRRFNLNDTISQSLEVPHPKTLLPRSKTGSENTNLNIPQAQSSEVENIAETCGLTFRHKEYTEINQGRLIVVNSLGHGSLGVVEEVKVSEEHPSFVRKRVQIPYHNRTQRLQIIKQEACVLEALVHRHIVKIIGSYSECPPFGRQFYSLLMSPVGDRDLKTFLEIVGDPSWHESRAGAGGEKGWLNMWFLCLASALAYMHSRGVRHQDIKPSNIIHRGSTIYFTDFSSSSQFEIGQTTSTDDPARTSAMYSAPEVINSDGVLNRHGRGTDVFALGTVFCEMLAVLTGTSVDNFHRFLLDFNVHGEGESSGPGAQAAKEILLYGRKTERVGEWFFKNIFYNVCVRPMLAEDREKRPDAEEVAESIRKFVSSSPWHCSCRPNYT